MIEQFASQPGVESEEFDCKSKELVERSSGREKLVKVLSAMANQNGGTVIVGIRKESDESLLIQGFSVDSEVIQHITHTALEYTNPPISKLLDLNFVEYSGKHVLRIDVDEAREKPIQYKNGGDYVPWIRIGDGMDRMSRDQMLSFFQTREREKYSIFASEIEQRIESSLDVDRQEDTPSLESPRNWLITTTEGPSMVVFGEPGLSHDFGKSVLYHVEERINATTPEEISRVFDVLEQTVIGDLIPSRLGYAIKLGERQVMGRDHRWFVEDLENIENTIELLTKSHDEIPVSNAVPEDPKPIAVAYASCPGGIFWFETQWRDSQFMRTRCGFVFTDLPFNDSPYHSFFSEFGRQPDVYKQQSGQQLLTISGRPQHLSNPQVVDISAHPNAQEQMLVDNPYYHRTDELENQTQGSIPEYLINPLDGVNRLPLSIAGGYTENEDRVVELDSMTVFSKNLLLETLFISGWCRQRRT
ncbi:helix-turn-helix domain-containing protein [Halorubrum sp. AJ67]|uniref:AlbA family DNA-binding domain-containing protein n=1 Tax=Halorubrum sp. AJ67 TaxID=1173487 RepID=UPI0018967EDE|nr:ATP-binding protein [Halorubrum sp. AJ67]